MGMTALRVVFYRTGEKVLMCDGKCVVADSRTAVDVVEVVAVTCYKALLLLLHVTRRYYCCYMLQGVTIAVTCSC